MRRVLSRKAPRPPQLPGAVRLLPPGSGSSSPPPASSAASPLSCCRCYSSGKPSLPGLFGIQGLLAPGDFMVQAQEAVEACEALKRRVSSLPPGRESVRCLDAMSNRLCLVIDAAELCRNTHYKEEWRESAEEVFGALSGYIHELNTDPSLYQAVNNTVQDQQAMADLSEEERRVAVLLKGEFESHGVHLQDHDRREVRVLLNEITRLESAFSSTVMTEPGTFTVDRERLVLEVPESVLHQLRPVAVDRTSVTFRADNHTTTTLLRVCGSEALRREVYEGVYGGPSALHCLQLLDSLVKARSQLSERLGYESHAHRVLADKMTKGPAHATAFLAQLNHSIRGRVVEELEMLRRAKFQCEGRQELQHWDLLHYGGVVRQARQLQQQGKAGRGGWGSSSSNEASQTTGQQLAPYFSLDNCLRGLALLCESLFGIQLQAVPLEEFEGWSYDGNSNHHGSRDLIKLLLVHPSEGVLGVLYLDLYPRPAKYSHFAQFTVRNGCQPLGSSSYQLPVVALVCNFAPSSGHAKAAGGGGQHILLSHGEVETLLHEFGHALHALLSRTQLQHVAGTRAVLDFVETPSHLFEYYAWDHRFLRLFAKHVSTGEELPESLIRAHHQSTKEDLACLDTATQLLHALTDQALFGRHPPPDLPPTSNPSFLDQLHEQVLPGLGSPGSALWPSRFEHFASYGAGYYTYLYDRAFAAHIWQEVLAPNPLSRQAGETLWKKMLVHGGGRDPEVLIRDVLGGKQPSITPLLRELGVEQQAAGGLLRQ